MRTLNAAALFTHYIARKVTNSLSKYGLNKNVNYKFYRRILPYFTHLTVQYLIQHEGGSLPDGKYCPI